MVGVLSVGAYAVHQFNEHWLNPPLVYFVPLADWQLLFVAGLALGYYRQELGAWFQGSRRRACLVGLFTLFGAFVSLQLTQISDPFQLGGLLPDWTAYVAGQAWQGYDHNPPLHMPAVFTYLVALYHLSIGCGGP